MALTSDLPPEILFLIFEFAAAVDRRTNLALLYVSRYVRGLFEPILYHTVVLSSVGAADVFTRCLSIREDKSFCPRYLRSLIAYDLTQLNDAQLAHLLPAMRGVTLFFCWNPGFANDKLGAMMPHLRSFYASARHPMVFPQTITHMTVRHNLLETNEIYDATLRMPCLTHLAIEWFTGECDERFINHPSQNLKVLVVLVFARAVYDAVECAKDIEADPRVVYVIHRSLYRLAEPPWVKYDGTSAASVGLLQVNANDLLYDYGREYPDPSKDSMWDIAEEIVERRRAMIEQ